MFGFLGGEGAGGLGAGSGPQGRLGGGSRDKPGTAPGSEITTGNSQTPLGQAFFFHSDPGTHNAGFSLGFQGTLGSLIFFMKLSLLRAPMCGHIFLNVPCIPYLEVLEALSLPRALYMALSWWGGPHTQPP